MDAYMQYLHIENEKQQRKTKIPTPFTVHKTIFQFEKFDDDVYRKTSKRTCVFCLFIV